MGEGEVKRFGKGKGIWEEEGWRKGEGGKQATIWRPE